MMKDEDFASQYIQLRRKEGKMYSDEELLSLPDVGKDHQLYKEWLIRKQSCTKLLRYIRKKNAAANILEIGCGNGWLTAKMASITSGQVTGLNFNHQEIEQARRVFGTLPNCHFIEGNIKSDILDDNMFDFIIFASSIQYFKSLKEIINIALDHLTVDGEIHIIDSMFYQYPQIAGAQEKARLYYTSMGFPEIAERYHHHFIDNLEIFQRKTLYDPTSWRSKFTYPKNPFHWIVITHRYR